MQIPTAVNVPLGNVAEAIELDAEDFEQLFGVGHPSAAASGAPFLSLPTQNHQLIKPVTHLSTTHQADDVVVYCRSGVRSETARQLMAAAGIEGVRNYKGSWLEWKAASEAADGEE